MSSSMGACSSYSVSSTSQQKNNESNITPSELSQLSSLISGNKDAASFFTSFPNTYVQLRFAGDDIDWKEALETWERIEGNLRSGIYKPIPVSPDEICSTMLHGLESTSHGNLLITHDTASKNTPIIIQSIVTGEVVKIIEASYFKLEGNCLYTASIRAQPVLDIWNLDSRHSEGNFSLKSISSKSGVQYMLYKLFFLSNSPIAIYKTLPQVVGSSGNLKSEYLITNLENSQSIKVDETYDRFYLCGSTLFAVSRRHILGISLTGDLKITEKYLDKGIDSLNEKNKLTKLINADFEFYAINGMAFLKCKNMIYCINRKNGGVSCTPHKDPMQNPEAVSFLEMPNGMLLVKLDTRVEYWDMKNGKNISSDASVKSPVSLLRYESGILYEINEKSIRIWDSEKVSPSQDELFISEASIQNVSLTRYDKKLFIQITCYESAYNKLVVFDETSAKQIIDFPGTLVSELPGFPGKDSAAKTRVFRPFWASASNPKLPFFTGGCLTMQDEQTDQLQRYDFSIISSTTHHHQTGPITVVDESSSINKPVLVTLGIGASVIALFGILWAKGAIGGDN